MWYHPRAGVLDCFRVSIDGIKHHDQKQPREERVCFSLLFHITVHQGSQDRSSKQEPRSRTEAEAVEKCCFLASSHGSLSCFFIATRLISSGLALPPVNSSTLIINQGNVPQALPTGQSGRGIFSIEDPSSNMTLAC